MEAQQEQQEIYDDYRPIDRFYIDYEQYVIGMTDEPPKISELDEQLHTDARQMATFLDWKYSDGLEVSMERDITLYHDINDMFLGLEHPETFIENVEKFIGRYAATQNN